MNVYLIISIILSGAVELSSEPVWESTDNDYSTGGVLADIDSDGDLDLVTGNGNDMARNPNKVYYNTNDLLEQTASWSSNNWGCHGHISLGDMDADGDLDMASAGFAFHYGWVSDPSVVYENQEGTFTVDPVWSGADEILAFSCDWGDADADGDLDLAIAAGNNYNNLRQKVTIYENNSGTISAEPMWESADSDYNLDVCWVDIDSDGDLDLAVGGYETNRIYYSENGVLNTEPGWTSGDSHHTIQLAFADYDSDGDMDMATADNNQAGDDASRMRIYINDSGELDMLPSWESKLWRYQSCVAWGDCDGDGDLDLAGGGWWEPASVYENIDNQFDSQPSWTWAPQPVTGLVCEQLVWGEVDNDNWAEETEDCGFVETGDIIYPSVMPILDITEISIGGSPASPADYLWNPANGWIQINRAGGVEVTYRYSKYPDLLVTNWDPPRGNFLFRNEAGDTNVVAEIPTQGITEIRLEKITYRRGEKIRLTHNPKLHIEEAVLYEITGRRIAAFTLPCSAGIAELPFDTRGLTAGVYILRIVTDSKTHLLKIQII